MSLDFGKLNFSTSFNPTSAFPLDARSYFESKVEADAAAATAEEVGSSNTVYYFGEHLVVVNKVDGAVAEVKEYVIAPNPDKSEEDPRNGILMPVGAGASSGVLYDEAAHQLYTQDEKGNKNIIHTFSSVADTSMSNLTKELEKTFVKEGIKVTAVKIGTGPDTNEYELDFTAVLPVTE